jgi:hypothetical protein
MLWKAFTLASLRTSSPRKHRVVSGRQSRAQVPGSAPACRRSAQGHPPRGTRRRARNPEGNQGRGAAHPGALLGPSGEAGGKNGARTGAPKNETRSHAAGPSRKELPTLSPSFPPYRSRILTTTRRMKTSSLTHAATTSTSSCTTRRLGSRSACWRRCVSGRRFARCVGSSSWQRGGAGCIALQTARYGRTASRGASADKRKATEPRGPLLTFL